MAQRVPSAMADRPPATGRVGLAVAVAVLLVAAVQGCQSAALLGREACWEDWPDTGDGPRPTFVPATVVGTITADMHDPKDDIWLTTPDGERVDFAFVGEGFQIELGPERDQGVVLSSHFKWEIAKSGDFVELWGGMDQWGRMAVCEIDGQRYTAPPDHNL